MVNNGIPRSLPAQPSRCLFHLALRSSPQALGNLPVLVKHVLGYALHTQLHFTDEPRRNLIPGSQLRPLVNLFREPLLQGRGNRLRRHVSTPLTAASLARRSHASSCVSVLLPSERVRTIKLVKMYVLPQMRHLPGHRRFRSLAFPELVPLMVSPVHAQLSSPFR